MDLDARDVPAGMLAPATERPAPEHRGASIARLASGMAGLRGARVHQWVHFLVLPLAGWTPEVGWCTTSFALARGVATAFLVLAFGYLVNALADREMDDPEKNPLATEAGDVRRVPLLLATGALAVATLGPPVALWSTAVCLASGWAYSVGPRLKGYPVIGTLLNATSFGPLLLVGTSSSALPPALGALALAFVGLLLQNQLIHEAADAVEDARGNLTTTVRRLGPVKSAYAAAVVGAAAPCSMVICNQLAMASVAAIVFVLIFPYVLAGHGARAARMKRARRAHRWASLVAGAALFTLVHHDDVRTALRVTKAPDATSGCEDAALTPRDHPGIFSARSRPCMVALCPAQGWSRWGLRPQTLRAS
jgi:4-hydroxybenzoate polyprenyltransferase